MPRNYAALKHDYLAEMEELTDSEFGRLCRELLRYSIDGTESQMEGNERFYWRRVKAQEDRAKENYDSSLEQKRRAGKSSAEKRKANSSTFNTVEHRSTPFNETNEYENEYENNTLSTSVEKSKKRQSRFRPPTREEVAAYCAERGNSVNADRFHDFYESNGWKVGKNGMKDWKAAVRGWEKREQGFSAKQETANERYSRELQNVIASEGDDSFDPWGSR